MPPMGKRQGPSLYSYTVTGDSARENQGMRDQNGQASTTECHPHLLNFLFQIRGFVYLCLREKTESVLADTTLESQPGNGHSERERMERRHLREMSLLSLQLVFRCGISLPAENRRHSKLG